MFALGPKQAKTPLLFARYFFPILAKRLRFLPPEFFSRFPCLVCSTGSSPRFTAVTEAVDAQPELDFTVEESTWPVAWPVAWPASLGPGLVCGVVRCPSQRASGHVQATWRPKYSPLYSHPVRATSLAVDAGAC